VSGQAQRAPVTGANGPPVWRRLGALAQRLAPWIVTLACFAYLYRRVAAVAGEQGVAQYMAGVFEGVPWTAWLALMIPYSLFYFLIDTWVLWRVVNWFNAPVAFRRLVPVRASTYILSIVNEQVGKGAIALYLNRREGVPAWQVGSSMLFIMFCEFYYLLVWALLGSLLAWSIVPEVFHVIPWIALAAALFFAGFVLFFRAPRFAHVALRERHVLLAFRNARAWQYGATMLMRSPALICAVFVYRQSAALFGVEIPLRDMLGVLPVIFFGTLIPGPFRAVAVSMWPLLFPEHVGRMTAFGFVQHNFFVLFNGAIGLFFLRQANRELFGSGKALETRS